MNSLFYLLWVCLIILFSSQRLSANKNNGGLACIASKNIPSVMDTVSREGRLNLFYHDSCAFLLLDSIYLKCPYHKKYLVYIDSICEISDGYLSEDIDMKNAALLMKHFDVFFSYLVARGKSEMYNLTISGLYFWSFDNQQTGKADEVKAFIDSEKERFKSNKDKLNFLNQLERDLRAIKP